MQDNLVNVMLGARYRLYKYCVSKAHYRYHEGIIGITYKIPFDDVDDIISEDILTLVSTRKCALGIKDDCYVIYQNGGKDILTFTKDISKNGSKIGDFAKRAWVDRFGNSKKFYVTFSLKRYFYEEGIASILDYMMKESLIGGNGSALVLTMIYPENLTLMEIRPDEYVMSKFRV